ncbi:MAG: type III secretion system gatekeeper subunit SctW [Kiritimatiellae bacterium]|nr:type III secretion system gatekeeper subunit SctW [Kiritimatiellia bacterium]
MAFDAAQILRQTYAAGAEAMRFEESIAPKHETPQVARGEIAGSSFVVAEDPVSELMDSMEELSFQFEEKEAKRASERKMGSMQGMRSSLVKALEAWYNLMPDMPGRGKMEKLAQALKEFQRAGNLPDAGGLVKMLSHESADPSHQFAMLDILEQMLGNDEELMALIRQAKAKMMAEKGPEIRVGINLAEEVNARATTPEEMGGLRDMYRSEVIGFTKPQDCFRSLLAARGADGLKAAIEFLIAGCGADLKSSTPSMDAAALGRILTDLQCVQVLETVMEALEQLKSRMGKQFGETCLMDGSQLTGRVLDMTEQAFVTSSAIAAFIGETGVAKLLARMDFARELTRLFRKLSPRLFSGEGDRLRLVDAAQGHLDELISEENELDEDEKGDAV